MKKNRALIFPLIATALLSTGCSFAKAGKVDAEGWREAFSLLTSGAYSLSYKADIDYKVTENSTDNVKHIVNYRTDGVKFIQTESLLQNEFIDTLTICQYIVRCGQVGAQFPALKEYYENSLDEYGVISVDKAVDVYFNLLCDELSIDQVAVKTKKGIRVTTMSKDKVAGIFDPYFMTYAEKVDGSKNYSKTIVLRNKENDFMLGTQIRPLVYLLNRMYDKASFQERDNSYNFLMADVLAACDQYENEIPGAYDTLSGFLGNSLFIERNAFLKVKFDMNHAVKSFSCHYTKVTGNEFVDELDVNLKFSNFVMPIFIPYCAKDACEHEHVHVVGLDNVHYVVCDDCGKIIETGKHKYREDTHSCYVCGHHHE